MTLFDKLFSKGFFYSQRDNIIRIKVTLQKKVNVVTRGGGGGGEATSHTFS